MHDGPADLAERDGDVAGGDEVLQRLLEGLVGVQQRELHEAGPVEAGDHRLRGPGLGSVLLEHVPQAAVAPVDEPFREAAKLVLGQPVAEQEGERRAVEVVVPGPLILGDVVEEVAPVRRLLALLLEELGELVAVVVDRSIPAGPERARVDDRAGQVGAGEQRDLRVAWSWRVWTLCSSPYGPLRKRPCWNTPIAVPSSSARVSSPVRECRVSACRSAARS